MLQCGMNLRVDELSRRGKETMVRRFDHEGLRQLQNALPLRESSLTLKFMFGISCNCTQKKAAACS